MKSKHYINYILSIIRWKIEFWYENLFRFLRYLNETRRMTKWYSLIQTKHISFQIWLLYHICSCHSNDQSSTLSLIKAFKTCFWKGSARVSKLRRVEVNPSFMFYLYYTYVFQFSCLFVYDVAQNQTLKMQGEQQ